MAHVSFKFEISTRIRLAEMNVDQANEYEVSHVSILRL